ncbi:glycerophosphodiester phosphodiesterase [Halosegnis sp.]|uniref:glycerophosphodiester phosphodiesterase n=1 Tax=Halosegnis sp. TaxID=2864959 RepID=UPI0035D49B3A
MRLIADRGFAGLYPENTLAAVEAAVRRADEVAVDVRRCDSGELVTVRDPTLDRVTDGSGAVCRHTLAELRSLSVLGTDERVPTLREVLAAVPPAVGVTLELREVGLAADALRLADRADTQVTVSSGIANELEGCRGVDPSVPRAYRFDGDSETGLGFARETDCSYLHPCVGICDESLVRAAHEAGFCVNAWGVDSAETAARIANYGADGLVADRVLTPRAGAEP